MSGLALAWEQFRLERKLFWRNPSAAFFDIAFPLIFLALFGLIFAGDEKTLNVIVPGLAGMATVSSTFTALAYRITFRREDGTLKRVRGRGAPKLNGGGRGDLLARMRLSVPTRLTKQEREALENLRKVSHENPRERLET